MEAAQQLEAEHRATALIDMAIASQGSGDSIKSTVRRLESGK